MGMNYLIHLSQNIKVSAGAPPQNVYGADVSLDFINLGYELFLDQDKLGVKFITADLFNTASTLFTEFTGRLDIIHATNFFQQWEWDRQIEAAKLIIKLLVNKPGSMIIGSQVGSKRAREIEFVAIDGSAFMHSTKSFKILWDRVSRDTGIPFDVQVTETTFSEQAAYGWQEELEHFRLIFTIRKI